jgi:hypothetical protein
VWVWWVLAALLAWSLVALALGLVLGRGMRLADGREREDDGNFAVQPADHASARAVAGGVRTRRRVIPFPPIGIGLAAVAVSLESAGYVTRLKGQRGAAAQILSMDAVNSLPRLFVTALFAAAAVFAVAGAGRLPGRRSWWAATGFVAAGIAAVKGGGTVHVELIHRLGELFGDVGALAVSILAACAVVGVLAFLSRVERRDRRRVLSCLGCYAIAAVGLSAVSALAAGAYGTASSWAATATYVEESGEALAGVAFLVAVLAGVAPRLVLPAAWALRRSADALTLDAAAPVVRRAIADGQ